MQLMQGAIAAAWEQLDGSELDPNLLLDFQPLATGEGAYVNGRLFASLSESELAFKLSDADQAKLLEMPNTHRLTYQPEAAAVNKYVVLPSRFHNDVASLSIWLKRSLDYVLSLPAPSLP